MHDDRMYSGPRPCDSRNGSSNSASPRSKRSCSSADRPRSGESLGSSPTTISGAAGSPPHDTPASAASAPPSPSARDARATGAGLILIFIIIINSALITRTLGRVSRRTAEQRKEWRSLLCVQLGIPTEQAVLVERDAAG